MLTFLWKYSKWLGFRDHLSYVTTVVTSLEWSLKTGLTVVCFTHLYVFTCHFLVKFNREIPCFHSLKSRETKAKTIKVRRKITYRVDYLQWLQIYDAIRLRIFNYSHDLSIYLHILQHPLSSIMCSVRVSVVLKGWENRICAVKRNCKLKERYIQIKTRYAA